MHTTDREKRMGNRETSIQREKRGVCSLSPIPSLLTSHFSQTHTARAPKRERRRREEKRDGMEERERESRERGQREER